jgi:anti-sigma B factor antagonist
VAAKTLEASVRHAQGVDSAPGADSVAIIDLCGEINAGAEEALNTAYVEAGRQNPTAIVLNFSGVDYINSTGIALIVGLLAQARKSNRRLLTFGLSAHYVEIFQITRLVDYMSVYPDEASALAAVSAPAQTQNGSEGTSLI